MKKYVAISASAALASLVCVSAANAQTVVTRTPRAHETIVSSGPNSAMLGSGLFTFGVPYIASVVVAANSDHPGDKNLYLPVVGPWLDFANRGDCGGLAQRSCDNETVNKVLLAVDGIFQGVGALEIVGAFLSPETRTVTVATEPRFKLGPSSIGRTGYGVAAVGTF
jgi:hypothetical protein